MNRYLEKIAEVVGDLNQEKQGPGLGRHLLTGAGVLAGAGLGLVGVGRLGGQRIYDKVSSMVGQRGIARAKQVTIPAHMAELARKQRDILSGHDANVAAARNNVMNTLRESRLGGRKDLRAAQADHFNKGFEAIALTWGTGKRGYGPDRGNYHFAMERAAKDELESKHFDPFHKAKQGLRDARFKKLDAIQQYKEDTVRVPRQMESDLEYKALSKGRGMGVAAAYTAAGAGGILGAGAGYLAARPKNTKAENV